MWDRFSQNKSMKYSGHRKLLCESSKLSKLNALILLGYLTNTDASILVHKFHPERTGFNMYAEYTRPQLTFLVLVPWHCAYVYIPPRNYSSCCLKVVHVMYYICNILSCAMLSLRYKELCCGSSLLT